MSDYYGLAVATTTGRRHAPGRLCTALLGLALWAMSH
jgi:hypothetical protein